ncbi:hypothetical protein L1987_60503 [Smallanthus sonchifolius]|uniref:Uncharacterized protein n=1 Tax=Smallanthus sonchifolius TaxID=185202 RepID=A0ACB9D896_9ASTR|nr:hypothetical protein L1987_60503 [Smallanthus sonchifolius]
MEEGTSPSEHITRVIGYIDELEEFGYPLGEALDVDLILRSFPKSYDMFIRNNVLKEEINSTTELHEMFKVAEVESSSNGGKEQESKEQGEQNVRGLSMDSQSIESEYWEETFISSLVELGKASVEEASTSGTEKS